MREGSGGPPPRGGGGGGGGGGPPPPPPPPGLYSRKWKSVDALPQNAIIGVPNDPSNEGRALLLLQANGLIRLRNEVGLLPTARDVADNRKHVQIKELDAGIVGRAIDDLDAAVVNTGWAFKGAAGAYRAGEGNG